METRSQLSMDRFTGCFSFRFYCLSIIVFLSFLSASGQTPVGLSVNPVDSAVAAGVMLIPYDPLYYLSDADHDIAEQTKRPMKEVRETFRMKSDYYTYAGISKYYRCVDLLHDTSNAALEDLITVFSNMGYRYEMPVRINKEAGKLHAEPNKKGSYENPQTAYRYKNPEGDLKYMHAVLAKPEMLLALKNKYATDYFVFLNQFEIKTNYNSCLDLANKVYQRTILLHYSIYDYSGKQIAGNFAYSFFPSNSSEANEIMKTCFASLGKSIAVSLSEAINQATPIK